ncbi:Uncharacterized protein OBRU01_25627 [Operophtera brumata]|uniref:Beta-ketoacyl synthase-like N-terminal domain-containing protein n=1 Tax=Operophtera brumata TaxID=104452 RepID=A0A0L7K569_OPEBR|nr:Uncharacterized protein OBRU01_25627 [Operophtera brumata]
MTPKPQSKAPGPVDGVHPTRDGHQVVISGMSGLYPKSRYIRDLENILYNKNFMAEMRSMFADFKVEQEKSCDRLCSAVEDMRSTVDSLAQKIDALQVNPVTAGKSRWEFKHPEVTNIMGKVSDLDRFDAQFFKVHYRQAHSMDPMGRKLLELAYEAIYDAGLNPIELDGKKIGVFIGAGISETENKGFFELKNRHGFGITG